MENIVFCGEDCKLLVIVLQGTFDYCSDYFWPLAKDEMILCIQFASIQNFKNIHENIFYQRLRCLILFLGFFHILPQKSARRNSWHCLRRRNKNETVVLVHRRKGNLWWVANIYCCRKYQIIELSKVCLERSWISVKIPYFWFY